jgi:hypothetical protein
LPNKVGADIKGEHQRLGIAKKRLARQVHKSTVTLLAVPRYSDLLNDQDDEDESERGRVLINSKQGWRTEMAKWISDARAAEADEDSDDDDSAVLSSPPLPAAGPSSRSSQWKPTTLAILFGGCKEPPSRLHPDEIDTEAALMQALAEREEDDRLDDGAVEINSDDEFTG